MLQEISSALGISLDEACKMQRENYKLFEWFEDKIKEVEEEYKDALEEKDQEVKWRWKMN